MKYFILLLGLCLLGCNHQHNETSNKDKNTIIPDVLVKDNQLRVFVKYKQPVNGYTVSICWVDTLYEECDHVVIRFQNNEHEFFVENPLYSDNNLFQEIQSLKNDTLIETDYTPFEPTSNTSDNMLFNGSKSPFFFFDIDFDGEKELIVTLFEGMGHHGHNAYKVYKIPATKNHIVLSPMQGEPFNDLNDYTEIDTVRKLIITPYDIGIRFGGNKQYGLVTHTFFNEATYSLEEQQFMELIEIEHYDWKHTENMKYEICEPTIYHYKKINGDMKLTNIKKCPNDK